MNRAEAIEYLGTLPPDEPVAIFRAQDKFTPGTVQNWASLCLACSSLNPTSHAEMQPTRDKGERAMQLVQEMRAWQKAHGCKLPD